MSADLQASELQQQRNEHPTRNEDTGAEEESEEEEADDDDDGPDDEPKLKYTKLTGSLASLYRNGDSTSASTVAGDKMALGTHNGNIHVLALPAMHSLRTYHAHSATITSVSVSPPIPPKSGNSNSNQIYIATSSLDGHVCVSSLLDANDVQLRNFARPVQAVALSPDYRSDRTYLSGGLAGSLILTIGGKPGITIDANTNSTAAAAASGFLGSFGLGGDRGKDTVLHSGEGGISTIKWSLSGKWVVWVNEEGIKIMRSHLRLGSEQSEDAWRRIAHAARPNRKGWEEMSGVWRGRCEWVDERKIEVDEEEEGGGTVPNGKQVNGTATSKTSSKKAAPETLVVGWGDTAWILHVLQGGTGAGGKKQVGSADIVHKLQFRDCIVSGLTLYTPSLLAILAYRTRDDDDKPLHQPPLAPKKGRQHRQTGLAPQLRLVNVASGEEVDLDELSISRFETLSAQDYHLGTSFIPPAPAAKSQAADHQKQRGALDGLWDVAGGGRMYAGRIFQSSAASVLSRSSSGKEESGGRASLASPPRSARGVGVGTPAAVVATRAASAAHPFAAQSGLKLFIQSPYDCVLAVKRDLADHLDWLLEHRQYPGAWQLVDSHPEIVGDSTAEKTTSSFPSSSQPSTPSRAGQGRENGSLADFFADSSSSTTAGGPHAAHSIAEKEKRRIGDLWLHQLVSANQWEEAGAIAEKVLAGSSPRWEHWVLTFAQAGKFDEISPHIPSPAHAHVPGVVYEVVLGHYISVTDKSRLTELLDEWDPAMGLYDVGSVSSAVEGRLESGEVEEESEDWHVLMEVLARLYLADGRAREALRCWIRTQNAELAMRLIREEKLMHVVAAEDVPSLLLLRVSRELLREASLSELAEASREAVQMLVEEALKGSVMPGTVIGQLERRGEGLRPFVFFYLRALWRGVGTLKKDEEEQHLPRRKFADRRVRVDGGHALVEDHADLAVQLFAQYDRDLLIEFLRASDVYNYEAAAATCERMHYIPELVHVLAKTGQTKRALSLIIDELGDVRQAIAFAKENPDLWPDLLDYGMDRPAFILGLLAEMGGSDTVDPVRLVRRIPEGLEIEGLKAGVGGLMREYDVQVSISEGVARVLRGEVGVGMEGLRAGRRKGVRFEVLRVGEKEVEVEVRDPPIVGEGRGVLPVGGTKVEGAAKVPPGHCAECRHIFSEEGMLSLSILHGYLADLLLATEKEPLVGFACGHVYHLSCLLKANPQTSNPDSVERLLSQLGTRGGDDDPGYTGRSVGAKVAHAHIIKNVLRGGCRSCVIPEGA